MSYKPILSERALGQLGGIPTRALGALAEAMAVVCSDPYDPLTTSATDVPQLRRVDFDAARGFATYLILDMVHVVRVTDVTWAG